MAGVFSPPHSFTARDCIQDLNCCQTPGLFGWNKRKAWLEYENGRSTTGSNDDKAVNDDDDDKKEKQRFERKQVTKRIHTVTIQPSKIGSEQTARAR